MSESDHAAQLEALAERFEVAAERFKRSDAEAVAGYDDLLVEAGAAVAMAIIDGPLRADPTLQRLGDTWLALIEAVWTGRPEVAEIYATAGNAQAVGDIRQTMRTADRRIMKHAFDQWLPDRRSDAAVRDAVGFGREVGWLTERAKWYARLRYGQDLLERLAEEARALVGNELKSDERELLHAMRMTSPAAGLHRWEIEDRTGTPEGTLKRRLMRLRGLGLVSNRKDGASHVWWITEAGQRVRKIAT